MVKINTVTKALPAVSRTTDEIIPYIKAWISGQDERFQRKVIKLFKNAGVDRRFSILDADEVFVDLGFEAKNQLYMKGILDLSEKALRKALDKAAWKPEDLDYIITVSCTGYMIPSVDAYLINRLKMRQDIIRLPVTEMGCVAGVSGSSMLKIS